MRLQVAVPEDLTIFVPFAEDGETSVHYAGQIMPNEIHHKDEDAKLISTLIDFGGEHERQTFTVRNFNEWSDPRKFIISEQRDRNASVCAIRKRDDTACHGKQNWAWLSADRPEQEIEGLAHL